MLKIKNKINVFYSDKRVRRIALTGISSIGSKGLNMLVSLISIPLTYNYLGEERFGMLMTILSVLSVLGFADFGLGLGLLNKIAIYEDNSEMLKKAISSTFYFLLGVSFFLFITLFIIMNYLNLDNILNLKDSIAIKEVGPSFMVFGIIFLVSLPFTIVRKVQSGFQEGYFVEIWDGISIVISIVVLVLMVRIKLGVPYLIIALYGVKSMFIIINFLFYFYIKRKKLSPSIHFFDKNIFKEIFSTGMLFFILQIFAMMNTSSDTLIISYFKGASEVAIFAIGYRLFTIFMTPVQAFIYPMLPAFNDAFAKKDIDWLYKSIKKLLSYGLMLSILLALLFYFFGEYIIRFWIDKNITISSDLLLAFSVYIVYFNLNGIISQIMMTPHFLKYKIKVFSISSILVLILKLYLINFYDVEILLWVTIIISFVFYHIPSLYKIEKVITKIKLSNVK